ncbi:MAG: extracellular solute-binding protein [Chloroflexota bacterium]
MFINLRQTVILLLCGLLLLAGCNSSGFTNEGATNEGATNAGEENGRITLYALPSSRNERYLAAFQREHPNIEVELVEDTAEQLTNLLVANANRPVADVVWGLPVANALQLEWLDLLKPYAPANLDSVDPRFRDSADPPHWVGTATRILVFCVNTDKTAELDLPIPNGWQDLLDPIYQGELTHPNPMTSGAGYLILATVLDQIGGAAGWDYLATLDSQIGAYAPRAGASCEAAAMGEVTIGISFDYRAIERIELGDPIRIVYPREGAGWDLEVNGLVRKNNIKPEAQLFLDWTLSETAVAEYAQDREMLAISENDGHDNVVVVSQGAEPSLLDIDMPWVAANRERIMREWISLYGTTDEAEGTR